VSACIVRLYAPLGRLGRSVIRRSRHRTVPPDLSIKNCHREEWHKNSMACWGGDRRPGLFIVASIIVKIIATSSRESQRSNCTLSSVNQIVPSTKGHQELTKHMTMFSSTASRTSISVIQTPLTNYDSWLAHFVHLTWISNIPTQHDGGLNANMGIHPLSCREAILNMLPVRY